MKFAFKTIHEFNDFFKDEKACYEWFEGVRWGGVPVCPHCGSLKAPYKVKARGKFTDIPSYRCSERPCGLPFTVRTKSIFEGSKITFRTWLLAFYEIGTRKKSISSIELSTRIGTSQKTAWLLNHKIRAMLKDINPELLKDYAAVDETRIGGKEKNKHANKKRQHTEGGWDKTLVFGAIGLGGKVKAKVVPDADGATLLPIVKKWIAARALMVSDELSSYSALKGDYWLVSINHSAGEYARGGFSTNGMENFWSIFKRTILGTFHSVSVQHLQAYVDEATFRYNRKDISNIERFQQLIDQSSQERITYKELTSQKTAVTNYLTYKS